MESTAARATLTSMIPVTEQAPALRRADGSAVRILVVDDEATLSELLGMALRYEGWEVRTAADGTSAVRTAREFRPDAVVLDVMLPDFDGFEVLRRVRADTPEVPVLFLTAKDAVEDRVAGLTAGGDDYVTKPFSIEELVARLRGLLRRAGMTAAQKDPALVVGDLTLDEDSHEVRRGGVAVELTATEFELLRFLMRNPQAGAVARRRSSTACGTTTSAASPTSSSSTSPTCGRRSTPAGRR